MGDYLNRIMQLRMLGNRNRQHIPHVRADRDQYLNAEDQFTDEAFRKRFRFSKDGFDHLQQIMEDDIPEATDNRGRPIPPRIQLQVALRFYATGSFQIVCGDMHVVSQSSVCRIVSKISRAIARKRAEFIRFPRGHIAVGMQRTFYEKFGFPRVVGCIDGTHIPIQAPSLPNRKIFRCRKGFMSLNVQAISDANMKFTNIVSRWPGSTHDARIFDNSRVCSYFENQQLNGLLLGDSGYPCRPFLMTPFRNPNGQAEARFNSAQKRTRSVVERMFGVWKRCFPCLHFGIRCKLETTMLIITATAVLHNIAINLQEEDFDDEGRVIDEDDEMPEIPMNGLMGNAV